MIITLPRTVSVRLNLIDTTAAAAGQIVLDLFRYAKWPISKKIAEAFFVSLSTDTGWFRFSNTDSRVYRDAADLIEAGAEPPKIYRRMYQNFSLPRMKLLVTMLNSLELHFDGRFAMQQLMWADFERTGSTGRDTENLDRRMPADKQRGGCGLFVEQKDGKFRCSLRSKGNVDVAKIASDLGGGGHKNAAGVTLDGPLEQAKKLIFDAVAKQFEQSGRARQYRFGTVLRAGSGRKKYLKNFKNLYLTGYVISLYLTV